MGTETKLSRCDQATFSCSRFSAASPHSNDERSGASLLIATSSASRTSASVSTSAYWNPWNVNAGSSTVTASSASTHVSVARALRSARRWSEPSGSRTSACRTVTTSPAIRER